MKAVHQRKSKSPKAVPTTSARGFFRFSSVAFFVLGMAVMLVGQWVAASFRHKNIPLAPEATPRRVFEYATVHLEVPDSLVPMNAEPIQSTRWVFERHSPEQLEAFLNDCDLTGPQKESLCDRKRWDVRPTGISLEASPDVIVGLSRTSRDKIYAALARSPANPAHAMPFRFSPDLFDGLLASSDLSAAEAEKVRGLTWSHDGTVCFSDLDLLKSNLPPRQFKDLVETLYSVPALLMRVRIAPDTDIKAMLDYWGKGGRIHYIKPLIESLTKVTNGTRLNVEYFLPPFARLRLNTFPNPAKDPMAIRQDCFWSAMNFFNDNPDSQYYDQQATIRALKNDYLVTREAPVFGDRIMLTGKNDLAMHMCVYIADGVVFTKNGADFKAPWVLMKLSDVLALYSSTPGLRLVTYRPKNA